MTGVNIVHVPYRGGAPAAIIDLLGGQVQVIFDNTTNSIGHIRSGKLRALAVTTSTRWAGLPEIPAVAEFVPGFEVTGWYGFGAPKNTPSGIVEELNQEINAALSDKHVRARLEDWGGIGVPGSPADFGRFIADETEKWGKVIRAANIKAD